MALKYRQVRRLALIVSFFAVIFVIYLASFSSSYPCHDGNSKNCNGRTVVTNQQLSIADRTKNEVHTLIEEGPIVKRSNTDDDYDVDRPKTAAENLQRNHLQETRSESKKTSRKIEDLSKLNLATLAGKVKPTTKKLITLSKEIRNFPVHSMYIQVKEADSPRIGDFPCSATVVPECCAFSVSDTNEAKRICEAFGEFCKGFVMSTISSKVDSFEYIMYLKKDLNGTMANYLTDFFIKVDFLDQLKWNEKR